MPAFYFPNGKPDERQFKTCEDVEAMRAIQAEFRLGKDGKLNRDEFADIVKMLGLPRYWKTLLFRACTSNGKLTHVTYPMLEQTWSK